MEDKKDNGWSSVTLGKAMNYDGLHVTIYMNRVVISYNLTVAKQADRTEHK